LNVFGFCFFQIERVNEVPFRIDRRIQSHRPVVVFSAFIAVAVVGDLGIEKLNGNVAIFCV